MPKWLHDFKNKKEKEGWLTAFNDAYSELRNETNAIVKDSQLLPQKAKDILLCDVFTGKPITSTPIFTDKDKNFLDLIFQLNQVYKKSGK